jgi:predicted DNA-binding transcriptional regulator YafY
MGNYEKFDQRFKDLDRLLAGKKRFERTTLSRKWKKDDDTWLSDKQVTRTIRRYEQTRGIKVKFNQERGYYTENSMIETSQVTLSREEISSLIIAREAMTQYGDVNIVRDLDGIFRRMAANSDIEFSNMRTAFACRMAFKPTPAWPVKQTIWHTLVKALLARKTLLVKYQSHQGKKPHKWHMDPYHVANLEGEWYVFAHIQETKDTDIPARQLRVSGIKSARVTEETFELPEDYDPEAIMSCTFGRFAETRDLVTVRIRFAKEVAHLIARKGAPKNEQPHWHPQQKVKWLNDSGLELSFPVSEAGPKPFLNVLPWVLSWGRHAKVVAPKELANLVQEEIEAMQERASDDI